ncbi:MAG: Ldh family oxidoreductase [Dehalococcoidia bacterium]|nr:Ldh family oxidoreductase [Dehalococcoidia bacterium]
MTDEVRVLPWQDLHDFTKRVFVSVGMPEEHATQEADTLMWANLRGVDSHGVVRIPWYVENIGKGIINPTPDIRVMVETPAVALIEADCAIGPVVTNLAADMAVEKAKGVGIGWILIRNHTHQGTMGQYVQRIANHDMAGMIFVCSRPNTAPFGARAAGVSNNPLGLSAPARRHPHLILDMATSLVAMGKVLVARDRGESLPVGWGLDEHGNPAVDPRDLATLLPVGGPKGSGMSLLFECMGSLMVANPLVLPVLSGELGEAKTTGHVGRMARHNQNSVVAAIDVSRFTDMEKYKAEIDSLIDHLKELPRADGFDEILMPGEREERCYAQRVKDGIPVPPATIAGLKKVADDTGIEFIRGVE